MKKSLINLTAILPVITAFTLMFPLSASAQVSGNYDLSAYKLPDIRYRQLETVFVLTGRNNSEKTDNQEVLDRYFSAKATADYNSFVNTRKIQRYQSLSLSLSGKSDYDEDSTHYSDVSTYSSNLNYQLYNKWYFHEKLFLATGAYARYFYRNISDKYEEYDTTRYLGDATANEHSVSLKIPLEIGIGRVEQVQDYYEAIYIYEDLLKSGRAVAGKSPQDVMDLAKLISQIKNKRYFDSRIKNIQDLETLDSFLIANNFKTQSDARYFATLVDNRNFVTHFVRESGTSIALAVNPEFNYYRLNIFYNRVDESSRNMRKSYGAEGGIVFEHHKPINLYWQTNTSVSAMAGIIHTIDENIYTTTVYQDTSNAPALDLYLNHSLQYYPNTRTRVTASINASYFKDFDKTNASDYIIRHETINYNAGLSLMADYYISQTLRLSADASVFYDHYEVDETPSQKSKGFNSAFGLRLAYSIF